MKPDCSILIAGSSQGVGRALAGHYSRSGRTVFGLSRSKSDLTHQQYRHIHCDVTKEDSLKSAFEQISQSGSLGVMIYSAAVYMPSHALLLSGAKAEEMLRTNLLGAFLVSRFALRLMKRGGFGRLIYLSSIAVPLGSAGSAMYGASKAGLEQMAFSMSRDFAADNITFNTIGISTFASPMLEKLSEKALSQANVSLAKSAAVQTEELVTAIDFFASDSARQITGQTIYFGGVR